MTSQLMVLDTSMLLLTVVEVAGVLEAVRACFRAETGVLVAADRDIRAPRALGEMGR
jgi:hypothetical protein